MLLRPQKIQSTEKKPEENTRLEGAIPEEDSVIQETILEYVESHDEGEKASQVVNTLFPKSFSKKKTKAQKWVIASYDSSKDKPLAKQDVKRIIEIDMECLAPGVRNQSVTLNTNLQFHKLLYIRDKGIIIGALAYKEMPDQIKIDVLNVCKAYQGNGIGSLLLNEILKIADQKKLSATLECPPWNQSFYSRFGFQVTRAPVASWKVPRTDKKSDIYPVRILEMRRDISQPIKIIDRNLFKNKLQNNDVLERKYIEAVKALAIFTRESTSTWYSSFGRSAEKENALTAIEESMDLQLTNIQQKIKVTLSGLADTVFAILRNAMIVRGFGIFSDKTTSGNKLIKLLANNEKNKFISQDQVILINKLLSDFYSITVTADSYEKVRKQIFHGESFYSTPVFSPYLYQ